ncbi:urea carboxylase-associated family protein [Nonomuraea sp. NPDC046802]|uniref:urea carboxylase-associated family protein n=1 Tax=Nonomuraea sp. NPDC046802 TaxID=3154919 RepID=UPI0033FB8375
MTSRRMTRGSNPVTSTTSRQTVVPPQSGCAVRVMGGSLIRVVDLEGHQVGDMWAIDRADPHRWLATAHTRDRLERLFPRVGEAFTDQLGEPILQLTADTSPGSHDMLYPPCNAPLYESAGLFDHPNCHDNFLRAVSAAGLSLPVVPDPVNLFQNSAPQPDGTLTVGVAASRAGDSIAFRTLRDLWFVLTSCSVDNWPTNNHRCTPLAIQITDPDA